MSRVSGTGLNAALNQDQFLQLLVSQLQNQDPLNPVSDTEFVSQLATLSQLQSIQNLNTNFAEMLRLQQLTEGANLIGRQIEYTILVNGNTEQRSGRVDNVTADGSRFVLSVGADRVGLDQITTLRSS
jgi:flagellar basal-body rod modification protein FlgD